MGTPQPGSDTASRLSRGVRGGISHLVAGAELDTVSARWILSHPEISYQESAAGS